MADTTTLKTDYKDDVLDTSKNTQRKYQMIQNEDGTVSFVDVTEYSQTGDSFGAKDVNAIAEAFNGLNSKFIDEWHTVTNFLNGCKQYTDIPTEYKKIDDIVYLNLYIQTPSNTSVDAFVLPEIYRPTYEKRLMVASGGTGAGFSSVIVYPNGNVKILPNGTGNTFALGSVSYMK